MGEGKPFDYGAKKPDGQFERHPTLPADEKKFIRPVRRSYKHVGIRPRYPTRPLSDREKIDHAAAGYVCFEPYPEDDAPLVGRFWTQQQLDSGCGVVTTMGLQIAETYAVNPSYYGKTFCCGCKDYFPVGAEGEFTWIEPDGTENGERVGT